MFITNCTICGKETKAYYEGRKYCSLKCRNKGFIGLCRHTTPFSDLVRLKISLSNKGKNGGSNNPMFGKRGDQAPNWKGGISTTNKLLRASLDYRKWREAVFERDNWTCRVCKRRGGLKLNADHIKPFALFEDLRFEVSNGRTLCEECHSLTDTYAGRIRNYASL